MQISLFTGHVDIRFICGELRKAKKVIHSWEKHEKHVLASRANFMRLFKTLTDSVT